MAPKKSSKDSDTTVQHVGKLSPAAAATAPGIGVPPEMPEDTDAAEARKILEKWENRRVRIVASLCTYEAGWVELVKSKSGDHKPWAGSRRGDMDLSPHEYLDDLESYNQVASKRMPIRPHHWTDSIQVAIAALDSKALNDLRIPQSYIDALNTCVVCPGDVDWSNETYSSWEDFRTIFMTTFGGAAAMMQLQTQIQTLLEDVDRTMTFNVWFTQLRALLTRTAVSTWDCRGAEVRKAISTFFEPFDTFVGFTSWPEPPANEEFVSSKAIFDFVEEALADLGKYNGAKYNELYHLRASKYGDKQNVTDTIKGSAQAAAQRRAGPADGRENAARVPYSAPLRHRGRLTQEEKRRRKDNRLCPVCASPGHNDHRACPVSSRYDSTWTPASTSALGGDMLSALPIFYLVIPMMACGD